MNRYINMNGEWHLIQKDSIFFGRESDWEVLTQCGTTWNGDFRPVFSEQPILPVCTDCIKFMAKRAAKLLAELEQVAPTLQQFHMVSGDGKSLIPVWTEGGVTSLGAPIPLFDALQGAIRMLRAIGGK